MNAKLNIYNAEFDVNGNKLGLKCNQNTNFNIKNISKFNNLNANSIRINNFNISGKSNNIEIEYTGNASVNISYNVANFFNAISFSQYSHDFRRKLRLQKKQSKKSITNLHIFFKKKRTALITKIMPTRATTG